MIEVLVTIVILAFGLLGLAGFQIKIQIGELESYQRAQALLLMADMVERIGANRANAASYVSAAIGTGDAQPASCSGLADGSAGRDICEWSNTLKGSAETSGGNKVGAMTGALGCIQQVQAANPATGVCTPAIYEVAVAWQGMNPTAAPAITCGANSFGAETYRRAIATHVTIGLTSCN